MKHSLLALFLFLLATPVRADEKRPLFEQRWFYAQTNLQIEKQASDLISLINRAGKSGYNGVVLADYKLNILDRVPKHYFTNLEKVKKAAAANKIEIIPAVFPIGYSAGVLAHDPNLAEGLPVKDAPFRVKGRTASLEPGATLANGGLEETKGDRFLSFAFQDAPGIKTFADRATAHSGKTSCRMENFAKGESANSRLTQKVKLRPHACYRFSGWVKTKDLAPAGNFKFMAMSVGGKMLTFKEGELKPTQDWTEVDVVFNSLDESDVTLYVGVWGGKSGTLWIDDLRLEELALVNILRRSGCPFVVKSDDGKVIYEEGKDYEPVADPKLGRDPWAGEFNFNHKGPTLTLSKESRIKDDDKVLVSWYHPVPTHSYQVMCCLAEEKLYDILRDQAKRVKEHLQPTTWFLSHDEIRVAGWCKCCQDTRKSPGELLADNVARCVKIIKELDPKAKIVIWSDMFDPHHNAVEKYYLVNGSLKESWKGLPPDIMVANWNGAKAAQSLKWFSDRGHAQVIAGYYDGGNESFQHWVKVAKGVPKVTGFMYTTWQHKYTDLEAYGKAMLGKE